MKCECWSGPPENLPMPFLVGRVSRTTPTSTRKQGASILRFWVISRATSSRRFCLRWFRGPTNTRSKPRLLDGFEGNCTATPSTTSARHNYEHTRSCAYSTLHSPAFMSSKIALNVVRSLGSAHQQAMAMPTMSAGAFTWKEGRSPLHTAVSISRGRVFFAQGNSLEITSQITIPKL